MPNSKQRREAERRRLQRQLQRRQQRHASRRRITLVASIVGTIAVIAIVVTFIVVTSGEGTKTAAARSSTPLPTPTAAPSSTAPRVPGVCDFAKSGTAARPVKVPAAKAPLTGRVSVSVRTTQGPMTFALNRAAAPCTVANFVSLVQQKYYDATPCHRLTTSGIYVLQCGDPTGAGTGGPGYTVPDEATGQEKYPAGTIAMARSQAANTGGSQFFIVYKDSPNLAQSLGTRQYTVFGTVSSGLKVVTKVAAAGAATGSDGRPKLAISITKATLGK